MTLPTKSACIVVNRIVGGKRREEKRERVDESDEKVLGGVLGGGTGSEWEGFYPGDWRIMSLAFLRPGRRVAGEPA
jgi:hypothetical protein